VPRLQILSLHERLDVDREAAGRGVVIGFIDLGFYAHPDLCQPRRRIRAYVDVTREKPVSRELVTPRGSSWHGTMTACSAAGSGYLSGGRYRGLATQAEVVLIKAGSGEAPRVLGSQVADAIRVPLRHPELGIRILSISLGISESDPGGADVLAAVAEVTAAGVTVFAAAGNDPARPVLPPARAASAIAVGGIDDRNSNLRDDDRATPYSFLEGPPKKPELLAPANLLAAPMLPGTLISREAAALHQLLAVLEEEQADQEFATELGVEFRPDDVSSLADFAAAVRTRMEQRKYIGPDHQHVDGTSFAAPIVASVAAQMLEVAPELAPAGLREGLLATATLVPGIPVERQGAGQIQPRLAVEWARKRGRERTG
jgi:serine protease AprX